MCWGGGGEKSEIYWWRVPVPSKSLPWQRLSSFLGGSLQISDCHPPTLMDWFASKKFEHKKWFKVFIGDFPKVQIFAQRKGCYGLWLWCSGMSKIVSLCYFIATRGKEQGEGDGSCHTPNGHERQKGALDLDHLGVDTIRKRGLRLRSLRCGHNSKKGGGGSWKWVQLLETGTTRRRGVFSPR